VNWLHLDDSDNVAVALEPLGAGYRVKLHGQDILLATDIHPGHKFALSDLPEGSSIIKYGMTIGKATRHIGAGEHVHVHNLITALRESENYVYCPTGPDEPGAQSSDCNFDGYRRENGLVGTRNEIWVLSTVGCVAHLAQTIARRANELHKNRCDGVYAFSHPFGCSQVGDDLRHTQGVLAALARNPNAGGVLIVGLGCENNQARSLLEEIPQECRDKVRFFNCQAVADEFEEGLKQVAALVDIAVRYQREPCPVSELVLGLKCGGSDGFSGLTANPLGFPVPTVKISSNTQVATLKKNWIDFDAGRVLAGGDLDSFADELIQQIIDVASGRIQTRSECNGQREIAIWKRGVTL
jgi:altronate hydrolase